MANFLTSQLKKLQDAVEKNKKKKDTKVEYRSRRDNTGSNSKKDTTVKSTTTKKNTSKKSANKQVKTSKGSSKATKKVRPIAPRGTSANYPGKFNKNYSDAMNLILKTGFADKLPADFNSWRKSVTESHMGTEDDREKRRNNKDRKYSTVISSDRIDEEKLKKINEEVENYNKKLQAIESSVQRGDITETEKNILFNLATLPGELALGSIPVFGQASKAKKTAEIGPKILKPLKNIVLGKGTKEAAANLAKEAGTGVAETALNVARDPYTLVAGALRSGERYNEALNEGATPEEARQSALMYGFTTAPLERRLGIERAVSGAIGNRLGDNIATEALRSAIGEAGEEALMTSIAAGTKANYKDIPLFSSDGDTEAIINPAAMAENAALGAAFGGLVGGGVAGLNRAIRGATGVNAANAVENAQREMAQASLRQNVANQSNVEESTQVDIVNGVKPENQALTNRDISTQSNTENIYTQPYVTRRIDNRNIPDQTNTATQSGRIESTSTPRVFVENQNSRINAVNSPVETRTNTQQQFVDQQTNQSSIASRVNMPTDVRASEIENQTATPNRAIAPNSDVLQETVPTTLDSTINTANNPYTSQGNNTEIRLKINKLGKKGKSYIAKAENKGIEAKTAYDVYNAFRRLSNNNKKHNRIVSYIDNMQGITDEQKTVLYKGLYSKRKSPIWSEIGQHEAEIMTEIPAQEKPEIEQRAVNAYRQLQRALVNSGEDIDRIAKEINFPDLEYAYNHLRATHNMVIEMITRKQFDFNGQTVGESLNSIFNPIRKKGNDYYTEFQYYLYHVHNIERMKQDKAVFSKNVTAEDSVKAAAELEAKHPEFKEEAEKVYKYLNNLMDYRVDGDLVTRGAADLMAKIYPHYVPTYRLIPLADSSSTSDRRNPLATSFSTVDRARGSNLDILPIHEQIAAQTAAVIHNAEVNYFGGKLIQALQKMNELGKVQGILGVYVDRSKSNEYNLQDELLNLSNEDVSNIRMGIDRDNNTLSIYDNGSRVTFKLDEGVAEGLNSMLPSKLEGKYSDFLRPIAAMQRVARDLATTYNPVFTVSNVIRDFLDSTLYSKNPTGFVKNYPKAFTKIATLATKKPDKQVEIYRSLGGFSSSMYKEMDTGEFTEHSPFRQYTLDKVEGVNTALEQVARFSEFLNTLEGIKKRKNKSGELTENLSEFTRDELLEAKAAADDITVNYGRSGSIGKYINRYGANFFNVSVQGASKFVRLLKERPKTAIVKLLATAAIFGVAPEALTMLLIGDDEDQLQQYNEISNYQKTRNYIIPVGDANTNEWIKIPKGRVQSFVNEMFKNIVGTGYAVVDSIAELDPPQNDWWRNIIGLGYSPYTSDTTTLSGKLADVWAGTGEVAGNSIAPLNPISEATLAPLLKVAGQGEDLNEAKKYNSQPIEDSSFSKTPIQNRYNEYTPTLMAKLGNIKIGDKTISEITNLSPQEMDYLAESYLRYPYTALSSLNTPYSGDSITGSPFTLDPIGQSGISQSFYQAKKEAEYRSHSTADGSESASGVVTAMFNDVNSDVSEINKEIDSIQGSSMTDKEKQEKTRKLKAERNQLMRNALLNQKEYSEKAEKNFNTYGDRDLAKLYTDKDIFGAKYAIENTDKSNSKRAATMLKERNISYDTYFNVYSDIEKYKKENPDSTTGELNDMKIKLITSQNGISDSDIGYIANKFGAIEDSTLEKADNLNKNYGVTYKESLNTYADLRTISRNGTAQGMSKQDIIAAQRGYIRKNEKLNDEQKTHLDDLFVNDGYYIKNDKLVDYSGDIADTFVSLLGEAGQKFVEKAKAEDISTEAAYYAYVAYSSLKGNKNSSGEDIEGQSKKEKVIGAIDSLDISSKEKTTLFYNLYSKKANSTPPTWGQGLYYDPSNELKKKEIKTVNSDSLLPEAVLTPNMLRNIATSTNAAGASIFMPLTNFPQITSNAIAKALNTASLNGEGKNVGGENQPATTPAVDLSYYNSGNPFGTSDSGYATGKHGGVDFSVPYGTSVNAARDGTVVYAKDSGGAWGLRVVVDMGDGLYYAYNHLSSIGVKPGDKVTAGQTIAKSGNSGRSTGPHLDVEVYNGDYKSVGKGHDNRIDPMAFFGWDGSKGGDFVYTGDSGGYSPKVEGGTSGNYATYDGGASNSGRTKRSGGSGEKKTGGVELPTPKFNIDNLSFVGLPALPNFETNNAYQSGTERKTPSREEILQYYLEVLERLREA